MAKHVNRVTGLNVIPYTVYNIKFDKTTTTFETSIPSTVQCHSKMRWREGRENDWKLKYLQIKPNLVKCIQEFEYKLNIKTFVHRSFS